MPFRKGGGGQRSSGSRAEHEGRTANHPGVPSGPRNTPSPPPVKVSVPYAPTKTGKAAEKKANRKRKHKAEAKASKRIRAILNTTPPAVAIERAKGGQHPETALKKYDPASYNKAEKIATKAVRSKENLGDPEDITHAIEIATLATGVGEAGLAVKAGLKGGEEVAARTLAKDAANSAGAAKSDAKTLLTKAGGKAKSRVKAKVKRVKETPERVKSAPSRAKAAAKTKEGRRAAGKGAAKTAAKHPVRSGYVAAAASPIPLPGELDKKARAFAEGTAAATLQHPKETLATTGKGVAGFLTAPVALTGAALKSAETGSAAPLEAQGKEYVEGTKKMVENLASGDPKRVERTTLHETGLTPFIPVPHLARRLKGTKLYEDSVRGKLRDTVETRRAGKREERVNAEKNAKNFTARKKAKKKVKLSVEDSARPGEHYVNRKAGKFIEKQRGRHYVSRVVAKVEEEGRYAGKRHGESVAKPLRKSPGTNRKDQNDSDALAVLVKHGIPVDPSSLPLIQRLHDGYGKVEHGDVPADKHLDRDSTQYILDHPELLEGKRGAALSEAADRFDAQAKGVGTSARHRYLAQVLNVVNPIRKEEGKHPILLPEERVPAKALQILPKRDKPWSRSEALSYIDELKSVTDGSKAAAHAKASELGDALHGLMRPPEHGGAEGGVSTTHAEAWTDAMERDYVREASAEAKRLGLREPAAYVANKVPSGLKGEEKAPNFAAGIPLRKIWPSRGKAAMSGNAESGFESLLQHSVESPRQRAALVKGLNDIFDRASRKVNGKRYLDRAEIEKAINTHQVPEGTIFLRTQALKSILEGDHTVSPEEFRRELMGGVEEGQKLASGEELAGDMELAQGSKGEKFAPMNAADIHELMAHMEPVKGLTKWASRSTNFATRVILNSPAFAAIQIPQEALPLAAALGTDIVHVPRAIANLKKVRELPVEDQAAALATVGSSVGVLGAPSAKALASESFMSARRAAAPPAVWQKAWNLVNGNVIGKFDKGRAGAFREVAALARIEGDFKRAQRGLDTGFNKWRDSARNLYKDQEKATEAMRGMNRAERLAYTASHPKLGDRLMREMNGMAGNWNSFTAFEKHFSPLTVFYPFQRYSVLWMLYHFPLDHPVVATALTAMGQVNARELEKIAAEKGATPSPLDYTIPVMQNGDGKKPTLLPAGQRIFPGLSTVQQAAVTGKPSQLIGEVQPAGAIAIEAIEGKNSYTGRPTEENGFAYALRQFGNLSPAARFLGLPETGQEPSAGAQVFGEQDPLRKWRSTFDPFIGQTAAQYAETKKLEGPQGYKGKYGKGDLPSAFDSPLVQKLLFGGKDGGPEPKFLPDVIREIHKQETASNFVKSKEQKFYGPEKPFSKLQSKLLQEVEDAWQTGPGQKKEKTSGGIGGSSGSIGGHPLGGSIGGSAGGGIGGHPVGGSIEG